MPWPRKPHPRPWRSTAVEPPSVSDGHRPCSRKLRLKACTLPFCVRRRGVEGRRGQPASPLPGFSAKKRVLSDPPGRLGAYRTEWTVRTGLRRYAIPAWPCLHDGTVAGGHPRERKPFGPVARLIPWMASCRHVNAAGPKTPTRRIPLSSRTSLQRHRELARARGPATKLDWLRRGGLNPWSPG